MGFLIIAAIVSSPILAICVTVAIVATLNAIGRCAQGGDK